MRALALESFTSTPSILFPIIFKQFIMRRYRISNFSEGPPRQWRLHIDLSLATPLKIRVHMLYVDTVFLIKRMTEYIKHWVNLIPHLL